MQGWRLRPCLRKLQRSQSHLMVTYYSFLWLVALLNGLRSIVQLLEGFSQEHLAIWNVLWLLTRCGGLAAVLCTSLLLRNTANLKCHLCAGLVLLEVSVVVFLLQGYLSSGSEVTMQLSSSIESTLVSECNTVSQPAVTFQALVRTLVISGTYAFVESLVTAVVIFGVNVPLFFHG